MTFMRRRTANALRSAAMRIGPVEPIVAPISVQWAEPPEPPKGTCAKCGKHIGKGLHFHTKACKGAS